MVRWERKRKRRKRGARFTHARGSALRVAVNPPTAVTVRGSLLLHIHIILAPPSSLLLSSLLFCSGHGAARGKPMIQGHRDCACGSCTYYAVTRAVVRARMLLRGTNMTVCVLDYWMYHALMDVVDCSQPSN